MPETPEIIRKRKRNMERNANFRTNLDAGFSGSLFPRGGGGEPTPAATSTTSGVGQPLRVLEEEAGGGEGEGLVPLCELMKQWPGRGEQIVELAQLVGEADDGVPVPTILVTGPPCCGKTGVVTGLLENRGCSYVYVNCSEIFSLRGLMEAVLEQVAGGSRESILEARRVSRRFGEAQGDAAIFVEEADWLPKEEPDADNPEGADLEEVLEEGGDSRRQSGARQRLSCSTWNVFFRQLLALLACRSQQHQRRHQQQQQQQQQEQQHQQQQQQQQLPSFPPKLFFVFDNVEALLTESTAGVGVGAGGGGYWRGAQLVDKLARISDMVSGYTGFAAAGGGIGGSGIGGSGSGISGGGGGGGGGGGDGGAAITATLPSLPPVCPILISLNPFFASEVMGGMGGGGGKGGARGGVGSLLARACPLQLRFPLYSPKDLPDVVAATAHSFGVDLDADLGNISSNLNLGEATLGGRGSASGVGGGGGSRGVEEGGGDGGRKSRKLFRKLAAALVQGLRSETWDAWELGNEAARLWPAYLKMAEDGYEDSELVAGLKPLLRETSKRLHGDEDDRGSGAGSGGTLGGGAATSLSAIGQGSVAGTRAGTGKKHELGLSRNGKTLLVAAYLASHNSRDTDRDVFTAKSTRAGRSMRRGAKVGNAGNLVEAGVKDLAEAQEFQLERLLSIVSSLVAVTSATNAGTKAANSMGSADLFLQIKSLTRLNLMRESRPGQLKTFDLDSPSYRCNISRELAQSVAEDIGITLSQYLVAN